MAAWEILEIEPTGDTKAIKRAYAKKLKVTRPDENPKGFQDLHDAYKRALQQAEWIARRQAEEDSDEEDDDWDNDDPLAETTNVDQPSSNNEPLIYQPVVAGYLPELFDDEDPPQKNNPIDISSESSTEILIKKQIDISDEKADTLTNPILAGDEPAIHQPIAVTELSDDQNQPPQNNNPDQPTEPIVNPYQLEGERLIESAKLLLATTGKQAQAESWAFILESPFILDDHFNWRLGLEILLLIQEHNISHSKNISIIVGANAMTYLDSIFNWNANRPQVFRALGSEYASLLDVIRDSSQPDNWKDKIRGGKKLTLANQAANTSQDIVLAGSFQRFLAYVIDWALLCFISTLLALNDPNPSPLVSFTLLPLLYFTIFEFSKLQGTIGKRLMKLRVTQTNNDSMSFMQAVSRSLCFIIYLALFMGAIAIASGTSPFAAVIVAGGYIYSCSKDPVLLYDKITKTRVIRIRENK